MRARLALSVLTTPALGGALSLLLAGCSSGPPPAPPSYRERAASRPAPKAVADAPEGRPVPVDRWRERLQERLPPPWRLAAVEAQIEAPSGWSRLQGDRGVALVFEDGLARQPFWLLPRGFDGAPIQGRDSAVLRAASDEFVLFSPAKDAPGWGATEEVIDSLEMH